MKLHPKLSIIILTWNTAAITKKAVDILLNKLKNITYEIIVVDNGSTDNTAQIFKKLTNIKYLNTGSNLGFSKGNNFGAKFALGNYLLFLNSDMEYQAGLDKMISYLSSHSDVGLIGPKFLNTDSSPQGSVFPPQTPINAFKEFWLNQNSFSKYSPNSNQPSPVNSISGGAVLLKRTLFNQLNGWNEKFYFYYEDLDLCRRIHLLSLKIVYFPDCQFIHHHGTSVNNLKNNQGFTRLVKSSKTYHGFLNHYLINLIIWSGQKFQKILSNS